MRTKRSQVIVSGTKVGTKTPEEKISGARLLPKLI